MPKKVVKEEKSEFNDKLDYLGLDLEKLPKFLTNSEPLGFVPSGSYADNEHRIFEYIPIQDIEILISPTNRLNEIKEKYSLAKPISTYLNSNNIEEYATFLKMINTISIEEIEEIEKKQEAFNEKIPFTVQYDKDYSWQIYYSDSSSKYFMLVTSEDYDFSKFFYLLKEQIKYHKSRKKQDKLIYVPVNLVEYSGNFLKKSEISDLENYLWLFTKNWPNIYEVHDKDNNIRIEIVGNTNIYKTIKSGYKIVISSKEEAMQYYKELKALFILQTELSSNYTFETRINDNCELELYYQLEKIDYSNILDFINNEYKKLEEQLKNEKNNISILESRLEELKQTSAIKDLEYINKQKEIAMYLEYKKTFFGKIRLFLKPSKKKMKLKDKEESITDEAKESNDKEQVNDEIIIDNKENYTIEDLVVLYAKLEKETTYIKNMDADIHALELKIKNMEKKIENATKYIEEIDNHKKSIFEFWRFVNKDELLAMEEGNSQEIAIHSGKIKRVFDYELDFTEFGIEMDKLQRKLITKEEQDSIFLVNSEVKDCINTAKNGIDDNKKLDNKLDELKDASAQKKALYTIEDFDIFGSISDNTSRVKMLANKKHRETEKDILTILNISKNTDSKEFKARIEKSAKLVSESMKQVKSEYYMPIYIATSNTEMIDKSGFEVYHIVPEKALEDLKSKSDKINLYKLDLSEGMPLLYYTNIMYYNNFNETLPLGMNISDKVMIDSSKFEFIPKDMITFKVCDNFIESEVLNLPSVTTVMLCEYELNLKENIKEEDNSDK